MAFLRNLTPGWPQLTCMTCNPINALHTGQGFLLSNLIATRHSWAIWPLVDPRMTCDPINSLHIGQGFLLTNLVATGHSWAFWPLVDPSWPVHDLWPHQCTSHRSGVLPAEFGCQMAFLINLTSGWPQLTCMTCNPINELHFSQGFFLPILVAIGHF